MCSPASLSRTGSWRGLRLHLLRAAVRGQRGGSRRCAGCLAGGNGTGRVLGLRCDRVSHRWQRRAVHLYGTRRSQASSLVGREPVAYKRCELPPLLSSTIYLDGRRVGPRQVARQQRIEQRRLLPARVARQAARFRPMHRTMHERALPIPFQRASGQPARMQHMRPSRRELGLRYMTRQRRHFALGALDETMQRCNRHAEDTPGSEAAASGASVKDCL